MKKIILLPLAAAFVFLLLSMTEHSDIDKLGVSKTTLYNDCAAILYKGDMLVDEYSPRGVCKLESGMKGMISVATVELTDKGGTPKINVGFMVAIENERTKTKYMYSNQVYQEIDLEDILKKCEAGDKIIIMTTDQKYALTHNVIDIKWNS